MTSGAARDMFSVPGLLSLARAPLAAAFPFVAREPIAALTVVGAAGLTDVLDGWFARRFGRASTTGAMLDPLMDKVFVVTVVVTLVAQGQLPLRIALLVASREIIELPLVGWFARDRRVLEDQKGRLKPNVFGKVVTVLQFATIALSVWGLRLRAALAVVTAVFGAVAGATYWARALRHAKRSGPADARGRA